MGVYDSIIFYCPECGECLEAQSKSGSCNMQTYNISKVPVNVAEDANRHAPFECSCGKKWILGEKKQEFVKLSVEEYYEEDHK